MQYDIFHTKEHAETFYQALEHLRYFILSAEIRYHMLRKK